MLFFLLVQPFSKSNFSVNFCFLFHQFLLILNLFLFELILFLDWLSSFKNLHGVLQPSLIYCLTFLCNIHYLSLLCFWLRSSLMLSYLHNLVFLLGPSFQRLSSKFIPNLLSLLWRYIVILYFRFDGGDQLILQSPFCLFHQKPVVKGQFMLSLRRSGGLLVDTEPYIRSFFFSRLVLKVFQQRNLYRHLAWVPILLLETFSDLSSHHLVNSIQSLIWKSNLCLNSAVILSDQTDAVPLALCGGVFNHLFFYQFWVLLIHFFPLTVLRSLHYDGAYSVKFMNSLVFSFSSKVLFIEKLFPRCKNLWKVFSFFF